MVKTKTRKKERICAALCVSNTAKSLQFRPPSNPLFLFACSRLFLPSQPMQWLQRRFVGVKVERCSAESCAKTFVLWSFICAVKTPPHRKKSESGGGGGGGVGGTAKEMASYNGQRGGYSQTEKTENLDAHIATYTCRDKQSNMRASKQSPMFWLPAIFSPSRSESFAAAKVMSYV